MSTAEMEEPIEMVFKKERADSHGLKERYVL